LRRRTGGRPRTRLFVMSEFAGRRSLSSSHGLGSAEPFSRLAGPSAQSGYDSNMDFAKTRELPKIFSERTLDIHCNLRSAMRWSNLNHTFNLVVKIENICRTIRFIFAPASWTRHIMSFICVGLGMIRRVRSTCSLSLVSSSSFRRLHFELAIHPSSPFLLGLTVGPLLRIRSSSVLAFALRRAIDDTTPINPPMIINHSMLDQFVGLMQLRQMPPGALKVNVAVAV